MDGTKQASHSRKSFQARKEIYAQARLTGATQKAAAIQAGYKESSAHLKGWQLDRDPEVVAMMDAQKEKLKSKFIQQQNDMLSCLGMIATFNIKDLFDENGNLIPIHLLPDHVAYAISSIDTDLTLYTSKEVKDNGDEGPVIKQETTTRTNKVKILDKIKAISEAAKILGLINNPQPTPTITQNNLTINNHYDFSRKLAFALELSNRSK